MYYCDRHNAIICDDQKEREGMLAMVHILASVCVVKTVQQMEMLFEVQFQKRQHFVGFSLSFLPTAHCSLVFIAIRRAIPCVNAHCCFFVLLKNLCCFAQHCHCPIFTLLNSRVYGFLFFRIFCSVS